jgi:hypothetical protein
MVRNKANVFQQTVWSVKILWFVVLAAIFLLLWNVSSLSAQEISTGQPSTIPAEIVSDWKAQDGTDYEQAIVKIREDYKKYADRMTGSGESGYLTACHWRRVERMEAYAEEIKRVAYAKHHDIGGAIIGYNEDLKGDGIRGLGDWGFAGMSRSDDYGQGGNSGIYLLEFEDFYPSPTVIIEDKTGVLRDPCPSYDGNYLVYAHSKDNNGYHICDIDMATKKTRQLTDNLDGLHVSDYEPCVLPSGDIIFSSSRCFGQVSCNVNITSNLFLIDQDGKYMRRVGYDQVSTFYPTMMEDGQVMYTRWEYNDRNIANCFGIFTMHPDGSHQMEWFGNQTEWPATFSQARIVPGSNGMKALAIIGGHQGAYNGDLIFVDASKGRDNIGVVNCTQLVAPIRSKSSGGGAFDMNGVPAEDKRFQNPYPLDDSCFLVSYRITTKDKFRIYFMDIEGNRELIAWDGTKSVSQPVSLMERSEPAIPRYQADYTKDVAQVSVANVYYGDGIKGVTSGVEKVRVVAMEYRTDPAFGNTGSTSYQMTPVGRFGGSWDAKWIVGEAPVAGDGSMSFEVPPNTPLFLQLIDTSGICVQTMRSWMTLKPGERFECTGCHENKNDTPPALTPLKNANNAKPLRKFYETSGEKGSFHFANVVQPVLNENCVRSGCHNKSHTKLQMDGEVFWTNDLDDAENNGAYRYWSHAYYNLSDRKYVNCNAMFGSAGPIKPRSLGSSKSAVITKLQGGHVKNLPDDVIPKIAAWIDLSIPYSGTYTDDMREEDAIKYLERVARREKQEAFEAANLEEWINAGQYQQPKYGYFSTTTSHHSADVAKPAADIISVRFNLDARQLSVRIPSEGTVKLLDLQGRQILSRTISKESFTYNATQHFKVEVSTGTYVVKFDGIKLRCERLVSLF